MTDSIARSIIKSELSTKLTYWTSEKINGYYGDNAPTLMNAVAFEEYSNGYIIARPNVIEYVDVTNGNIYKLRSTENALDYTCFTALNTRLTDNSANVRIESAAFNEVLSDGKQYTEITAPEGTFGDTAMIAVTFQDKYKTAADIKPYVTKFIDAVAEILPHVVAVADAEGAGITTAIFRIDNFWEDDSGAFFSNCDTNWTTPASQAKAAGLLYLTAMLENFIGSKLTAEEITDLYNYAEAQWS